MYADDRAKSLHFIFFLRNLTVFLQRDRPLQGRKSGSQSEQIHLHWVIYV